MARSALAEVIHLPTSRRTKQRPQPKTWQGEDDILFHKRQIAKGVQLENFGRKNHGSVWTVRQIITFVYRTTTNSWRPKPSETVVHLSDELVLVKEGSNETRQVTFGSLSYSAVWRLKA